MFKEKIAKAVSEALSLEESDIIEKIEDITEEGKGDLALPCFVFSKTLRKSPVQIAEEIQKAISLPDCFEKCESLNGYLNFYYKKDYFMNYVADEINEKKEKYGSSEEGKGKTCFIEHTSINPNASPHIGRARNAIVGDFLARLMRFEGYETDVHYFVNDIGKQISMLVLASESAENIQFSELLDLYVSINKEIKENPELEKKVFDLLNKLENGDEETRKQFRNIVDICIEGQTKILNELGIFYDKFDYESKFLFDNSLVDIIEKLKKTGLLFEDEDGRYVVNLEKYNLSPLVVTRGDKTSLYPLRDIAYTIWKSEQNADKNYIVLGEDQILYFKQISAIVSELGYKPPQVVHYSFVLLVDGKMSTRQGTVVLLEDFMRSAVEKAEQNMRERDVVFEEDRARKIAYAAVKYSMENSSNEKNVVFDLENALKFEGETGAYLQYSYVRINSILRKCEYDANQPVDYTLLKTESEFNLFKDMHLLNKTIHKAKENMSPHIITKYIFNLAKDFAAFYHECSIVNAESEEIKRARVELILCVKQIFENIFQILGISLIEKM